MKHTSDAILHHDQATYLEGIEPPRDALLAKLERLAAEQHQPVSDPEVASFLAIAVRSHDATRIVELGTNIGYGAIVMGRASRGQVITIEKSRALCETARGFIAEAKLERRVEVREGGAIEQLERIGEADFVYIDCVKEEYPRYLELALPRLSPRGVIVADNVLWKGLVAREHVPEEERARVDALRAFNRAIVSTPGLRGVILPLGDGVAYAVKT